VLQEFDWDANGDALDVFRSDYLEQGQNGAEGIEYPHAFIPTCNTGVSTGFDLDGNGNTTGGADAHGFGSFEGQYCFAILSRYPILADQRRSFQLLPWAAMPENRKPEGYYPAEADDVIRLSSKNHVDLPVDVDGLTFHVLAHHPTPPVFDGPEDLNGRRNADEIRLWADYLTGGAAASYLVDDQGGEGGLAEGVFFTIFGDHNSDPFDGDSVDGSIQQLLDHPRVNAEFVPESDGGAEKSAADGGINDDHVGDPRADTADFSETSSGNLRLDYVLPSTNLEVVDGAVYWPTMTSPEFALNEASDHKLVWIDLRGTIP
jgi:hypothetical protein